jgi:hypothetical protein
LSNEEEERNGNEVAITVLKLLGKKEYMYRTL